jgi:hypothetical protein
MSNALPIEGFPTAAEVRAIKGKKEKQFEALKTLTGEFLQNVVKPLIVSTQENDGEGFTSPFTTCFKFPEFVKYDERDWFVNILKDTLQPLGYKVFQSTDSAQEPQDEVVVTWKEQPPMKRVQTGERELRLLNHI